MTEVFQTADARGAYDQYLRRSFEKLHVNSLFWLTVFVLRRLGIDLLPK
jgi:hypothetical protein